jgi:hypothetical protein
MISLEGVHTSQVYRDVQLNRACINLSTSEILYVAKSKPPVCFALLVDQTVNMCRILFFFSFLIQFLLGSRADNRDDSSIVNLIRLDLLGVRVLRAKLIQLPTMLLLFVC